MKPQSAQERATIETVESLQKVARSLARQKLTQLTLPEVDAVVDQVAKIIPAGNVPGMILSGLTRISGKNVQPQKAKQDINILFKEVPSFLEHMKYQALFATPARIIWGYQNLLKLAGKDPESAFPEGIWQFYVDYALREDTARHANETHGFDTILHANNIHLNKVDRLTAWVMASVMCLHQYHSLLASEWYERTSLWLLQEVMGTTDLYTAWEKQKPYGRDAEGANYDYPGHRRLKFAQFLTPITDEMPHSKYAEWDESLNELIADSLPAYQKQMSILAYLEASPFGETRIPYLLRQAKLGIIHEGNYFLLPVCEPGTSKPLDVRTARSQLARLLAGHYEPTSGLADIARLRRADVLSLRKKANPTLQTDLEKLQFAPILINSDKRDGSSLLSEVRQGERGIGDHALTIFDTGKTFVFDQSHIFFDGTWGAALAEIMTNEALSWAVYLTLLSPAPKASFQSYVKLDLPREPSDEQMIRQARQVSPESGAENSTVDLKACLNLRGYFQERSDLLKLTMNDLLVLYRTIHAVVYQSSSRLQTEIEMFKNEMPDTAEQILHALEMSKNVNPSILIPVDASKRLPRDRIYPLNVEVPLAELDLLNLHTNTIHALTEYESATRHNEMLYKIFSELQRRYLATLSGFGTILAKAKTIAVQGESASVGAIKLLAHLPTPIKQLLDKVPARYEKLNNLIKGTEVLSNLGAVAISSSLTRFITAKDDNEQKQLTWGIMTNAQGVMYITLRDFRPHVALLHKIGKRELANLISQDYLDVYVQGLNTFVQEVTRIAIAHPRGNRHAG